MIYLIQNGRGNVKIGYSSFSPEARMATLQTGSDSPLLLRGTIVGDASNERQLHATMDGCRVCGEWFSLGEPVLKWIRDNFGAEVETACLAGIQQAAPIPPGPRYPRPPGFPLFPHRSGQWAKKVRGRLRYFGRWTDPQAALTKWHAQKDDLLAGRPPRTLHPDELLLHQLLNGFLAAKKALLEEGRIVERSWADYLATCKRLVRVLGRETPVSSLGPEDFQRLRADMAKTWGPTRMANEIRRCRMPFRWAVSRRYLRELPDYGDAMTRPPAKLLRQHRASRGLRMFEAEQIRGLLAAAGPTLRAMTLLGINCGLGNHDVALLRRKHVDVQTSWLDFPRPKTGLPRRCPLWPETIAALRKVRKLRKARDEKPAERGANGAGGDDRRKRAWRRLVFLTKHGRPWLAKTGCPISAEFKRLLKRCGLVRNGLNFYALRHTFQTIADSARDPQAVAAIMGHVPRSDDMSAVYRERIDNARLQAVSDHVHQWLFGEGGE